MSVMLVCLNAEGRAIQSVGPFERAEDALTFFHAQAAPAYHGYTITSYVKPSDYSERTE